MNTFNCFSATHIRVDVNHLIATCLKLRTLDVFSLSNIIIGHPGGKIP